jgi:DNA topoisomerase-1
LAKRTNHNNQNIVIVESPAKAKTIERYLGKGYKVTASMGHVRDLPPKKLGVDLENDFEPEYEVLGSKKKVVGSLKKAVRGAGDVYMATDLDREGEAIAWHLCQALGLDPEGVHRVTFNEITKSAIQAAFAEPGRINMDKVSAQEARRILDRLVGYKLSPLLWKKIAKGLSAGRVQSVATRLVVEKEQELRAFRPEESWRVAAELAPAGEDGTTFTAQLAEVDGEAFAADNRDDAHAVGDWLRDAAYSVRSAERTRKKDRPSPPFITSELQRAASSRLGFSTRKTMTIAQHLYQGVELGAEGSVALITYMRTDSHRVAPTAQHAARDLIRSTWGEKYLPEKPTHYRSKKSAQEAHEAIRPTDVSRTPESVAKHLGRDDARLYELVWTQFVASQMTPALWDVTDVEVEASEAADAKGRTGLFKARGRVLVFDGYTKVAGVRQSKDEQQLPDLAEQDALTLVNLDLSQHFSRPPARYTEASLVRKLEELGIGRPSTYATIISTIQDRGYVEQKPSMYLRCTAYPTCRYTVPCDYRGNPIGPEIKDACCNACGKKLEPKHGKRCLYATDLGEVVTEKLVAHFPQIMDYEFTGHMEDELDDVEASRIDWLRVVREFWDPFAEALEQARDEMESAKHQVAEDAGPCPDCGGNLVKRWSKNGPFLGCQNFPDCKYTRPLEADQRPEPKPTEHECEKCGGKMLLRTNRRGEPFLGCENYPKCRNTLPCDDQGNPIKPIETDQTCEKCGSAMVVKRGRRGPFLACSGFPKCRNTRPLTGELREQLGLPPKGKGKGGKGGGKGKGKGGGRSRPKPVPTDRTCPDCGKNLVIRSGRRGKFLGCSGYPKCRHTENLPDDLKETAEAEGG